MRSLARTVGTVFLGWVGCAACGCGYLTDRALDFTDIIYLGGSTGGGILVRFCGVGVAHPPAHQRDRLGLELLERGGVKIGQHGELKHGEAIGVAAHRRRHRALAQLTFGACDGARLGASDDDFVANGKQVLPRETIDRGPLQQGDDLGP